MVRIKDFSIFLSIDYPSISSDFIQVQERIVKKIQRRIASEIPRMGRKKWETPVLRPSFSLPSLRNPVFDANADPR